ncbi:MAG: 4-phosphoerythronate dehydrogenase [Pseudomonadales bacterium]
MSGPLAIVADENIAAIEELFAGYASIRRVAGRNLKASDLDGADALLVRSVTQVDQGLLAGSTIKFVGSATIGTEHVDLDYLAASGIQFANAPGSNADSVADYVCSALAALLPDLGCIAGAGLKAGVIGYGQVGSRVTKRLQALGYHVSAYDPFLPTDAQSVLASFNEVIQSDVLSLNVPLTRSGPHPTWQMINSSVLEKLPAQSVLLNTCRGSVIDEPALASWLDDSPGAHAVLDVWEREPAIDATLAAKVSVATPHIAGYALDGKIRGSKMLASAFIAHFGLTENQPIANDKAQVLSLTGNESLNDILLQAYDVRRDDAALRRALIGQSIGPEFDQLRKSYPMRREYSATTLQFSKTPTQNTATCLQALGFKLALD